MQLTKRITNYLENRGNRPVAYTAFPGAHEKFNVDVPCGLANPAIGADPDVRAMFWTMHFGGYGELMLERKRNPHELTTIAEAYLAGKLQYDAVKPINHTEFLLPVERNKLNDIIAKVRGLEGVAIEGRDETLLPSTDPANYLQQLTLWRKRDIWDKDYVQFNITEIEGKRHRGIIDVERKWLRIDSHDRVYDRGTEQVRIVGHTPPTWQDSRLLRAAKGAVDYIDAHPMPRSMKYVVAFGIGAELAHLVASVPRADPLTMDSLKGAIDALAGVAGVLIYDQRLEGDALISQRREEFKKELETKKRVDKLMGR